MSNARQDFSKIGFAKTFILPALLIFTIPIASYCFFLHAQSRYDAEARKSVVAQIQRDGTLTAEEREESIALFTKVPFSELMKDAQFAAQVDESIRRDFWMFRWLIRISLWSIIAGVAVFVLAGICVLLSLNSQLAQYLSLSAGWHVLRIYGALQTVAQGLLLVALSYWVTALWIERISIKLILVIAFLAVTAVGVVLAAIFKRQRSDHVIEGKVIESQPGTPLWDELSAICDKVRTARPDQIVVGIDDNFFVTEMPVVVEGKTYHGRTLYVSLSLLKQMNGSEADAVLAHEMAHFSGQDTLYSKKISPLLVKYAEYLEALYSAPVARPVFYFMNCFRALYEVSLGKLRRQREFRADNVAATVTSPSAMAAGLLRVSAYSSFRNNVQSELFKQEQVLESANISERIAAGFHAFSASFATSPTLRDFEALHPFDSHPPLSQRLEAVGVPMTASQITSMLNSPGDGSWYRKIENAAEIERQQWSSFEQQFRAFHEETLPYRFLPSNDYERQIVEKAFPPTTLQSKDSSIVFDCDKIAYAQWPAPIEYREIKNCAIDDSSILTIHYDRGGKQKLTIKTKTFGKQQQQVLDLFNAYYNRYLNASAYQKQKALESTPTTPADA